MLFTLNLDCPVFHLCIVSTFHVEAKTNHTFMNKISTNQYGCHGQLCTYPGRRGANISASTRNLPFKFLTFDSPWIF